MNFLPAILDANVAASPAFSIGTIVLYIAFFGVLIYFMIIRPQKKQQKQQDELMQSLSIGDSVLTTSGFYGVCIDIVDENVVIVEFGNNKNCRIPMKKANIVEIEKPEGSKPAVEEKKEEAKEEKKSLFKKKEDK